MTRIGFAAAALVAVAGAAFAAGEKDAGLGAPPVAPSFDSVSVTVKSIPCGWTVDGRTLERGWRDVTISLAADGIFRGTSRREGGADFVRGGRATPDEIRAVADALARADLATIPARPEPTRFTRERRANGTREMELDLVATIHGRRFETAGPLSAFYSGGRDYRPQFMPIAYALEKISNRIAIATPGFDWLELESDRGTIRLAASGRVSVKTPSGRAIDGEACSDELLRIIEAVDDDGPALGDFFQPPATIRVTTSVAGAVKVAAPGANGARLAPTRLSNRLSDILARFLADDAKSATKGAVDEVKKIGR